MRTRRPPPAARLAPPSTRDSAPKATVGYRDGVPWDYPVTIASEFTAHGYQTQAVGKMHVYPERSQVGFQNVILHDSFLHFARSETRNHELVDDYLPWLRAQLGRSTDYFEHGVNCNLVVARPWDKPEHTHPTNWVVSQSIDFLRRRDPRKPFFLFMSFHRPHPPYDPPGWAFEQYLDAPMPEAPVGDWVSAFKEFRENHRPDPFVAKLDSRALRQARAGYYGHMTHIDHQINRFMETLQEFGQHENTYFCFVSDHGEMMGDHDMYRKGSPYEGSARVPLLLTGPGVRPGVVSEQPVDLRDVMPTLLECASLPVPESVEGLSFLPFARGEESSWREYLHGEHTLFGQSLQWLTDGREKYVWLSGTGREQLFNLEEDPRELRDLSHDDKHAARLSRWRRCMMRELAGREERFIDGERLIPGRSVSPILSHLHEAKAGSERESEARQKKDESNTRSTP